MEGSSEERCGQLVAELAQVLEMVRQLEAHMVAGQQQQQQGGGGAAAGGDQRGRALVCTMRASIDKAVDMAMSCCAGGGRLPAAIGQPESPPSGRDGSPRSGGSDQASDSRGRGNAAGQYKKRKTLPKWSTQVRVSAVQDMTPLDDGLSWRKYGQKDILGAKYPRAYFRCTHRHTQNCLASKQVQRTDGNPLLFDLVYHGSHTCAQAEAAAHLSISQETEHSQQSQPKPGQEQQTSASAGFDGLPFSLPSNKPAGADDTTGGASSGFPGCVTTTAPFVSQATPEYQLVSSGSSYAVCGGGMTSVRSVPDVELAFTTHSPTGGMDFMFSLDDGFLENPGYF